MILPSDDERLLFLLVHDLLRSYEENERSLMELYTVQRRRKVGSYHEDDLLPLPSFLTSSINLLHGVVWTGYFKEHLITF